MREIWVRIIPYEKILVTTALEAGAHGIWVERKRIDDVRALGRVKVLGEGGDLEPGKDFFPIVISSGEDQDEAISLSRQGPVIVETTDWRVIPLENLVAASDRVFAVVKSREEIELALGVLEKGVAGVVVDVHDPKLMRTMITMIHEEGRKVELTEAEIMRIKPLGMGDRVCVDTCSLMGVGEGILVGNSGSFLFLVHAESVENPYVAPRPFRVNAGAVHAYTLVPGGKTRYLSELQAGDEVLLVNHKGESKSALVGRAKVEKRPLLLVTAQAGDIQGTCILQNAETIRLVSPQGEPLSVVSLQKGNKVMIHLEEGGRHFGMKVKESIQEK
jgi:3-dehydroquinate synthase II